MQTEEQLMAKIDSMIPELINSIREKAKELYHSGGIDPEKYEDNFLLPKIILTATLKDQVWQYMPFSPEAKKIVKNLEHF